MDRKGLLAAPVRAALLAAAATLLAGTTPAAAQSSDATDGRNIRRVLVGSGDGENIYRLACPNGRIGVLTERFEQESTGSAGSDTDSDSLDAMLVPAKVSLCYTEAQGEVCTDGDVYKAVVAACNALTLPSS